MIGKEKSMRRQLARAEDQTVQETLFSLQTLLGDLPSIDFAVRLWDGSLWGASPAEARFTWVLNHPGALRRMFWPLNELSLGEAYIFGDFDIEGDLEAAFSLGDQLLERHWSWREKLQMGKALRRRSQGDRQDGGRRPARLHGAAHSRRRDSEAVTYHYDVSNDFYRLWLDQRMVYSCGYFTAESDDLDKAQEGKLDYICRKLRLRPGERLLDLGCGWGGLILHAARKYGAQSVGITLSRPQAELANERIRAAGLADRCRAEVRDYREIEEWGGFDKLVSVGMFEHVGESRLPEYFERAWRLLRPGGVFLNHGITKSLAHPDPPGPSFIDQYVFPDGELLPIATTVKTAEICGFEVRDLESLREHYALTLRHWVRRLEAQYEKARRLTNEVTCRIWKLYMAGSAHGFRIGRINVYQALLSKPDGADSRLPLTRDDWYCV